MNFMAKSTPKKLVVLVLSAVMALSCLATGAVSTASAREADELDPNGMKVTAGSQEGSTPISNAFDDNKGTMWETNHRRTIFVRRWHGVYNKFLIKNYKYVI